MKQNNYRERPTIKLQQSIIAQLEGYAINTQPLSIFYSSDPGLHLDVEPNIRIPIIKVLMSNQTFDVLTPETTSYWVNITFPLLEQEEIHQVRVAIGVEALLKVFDG